MPKVYLTHYDKMNARLAAWVYGQVKVQNTSISKLAKERGISQQAMSAKLRSQRFNYEDFLCFVGFFKPDDNELLWLIRGK